MNFQYVTLFPIDISQMTDDFLASLFIFDNVLHRITATLHRLCNDIQCKQYDEQSESSFQWLTLEAFSFINYIGYA